MSQITVVKIGTESLYDFHNSQKVNTLVRGIVDVTCRGVMVLLVTSGAVQFGREALGVPKNANEDKPMLAGVGWHRLVSAYEQKFSQYSLQVAGILVTHADIEDSHERGALLSSTISKMWKSGIIPIVNENDTLSIEEMDALKRGGDNDKNALLLAKLLGAGELILITNTNGVYQNKDNPATRIASIPYSELTADTIFRYCGYEKSNIGTGGMRSKLETAYEAGTCGIHTHIGNGIDSGIHDTYSGGTNILGGSRISAFKKNSKSGN